MNDAPSMPRPSACSTTPSNTASPVLFSKSATSTDNGSREGRRHRDGGAATIGNHPTGRAAERHDQQRRGRQLPLGPRRRRRGTITACTPVRRWPSGVSWSSALTSSCVDGIAVVRRGLAGTGSRSDRPARESSGLIVRGAGGDVVQPPEQLGHRVVALAPVAGGPPACRRRSGRTRTDPPADRPWLPCACSGAMYSSVPITEPAAVCVAPCSTERAMPKSMISASPSPRPGHRRVRRHGDAPRS